MCESILHVLHLPEAIGIALFMVAAALALAPYLGGKEIGPLKVPKVSSGEGRWLKLLGPVLVAGTILLFIPVVSGSSWHSAPRKIEGYVLTSSVLVTAESQAGELRMAATLRKAPNMEAEDIGQLPQASRVRILHEIDNWLLVQTEPSATENK